MMTCMGIVGMKYTVEIRLRKLDDQKQSIIAVKDVEAKDEESAIEFFSANCKRKFPGYEVWESGIRVNYDTYRNFNL